MTNRDVHQQLKHYKAMRAAARVTGNRAESQRCSDMIEMLSSRFTITG